MIAFYGYVYTHSFASFLIFLIYFHQALPSMSLGGHHCIGNRQEDAYILRMVNTYTQIVHPLLFLLYFLEGFLKIFPIVTPFHPSPKVFL